MHLIKLDREQQKNWLEVRIEFDSKCVSCADSTFVPSQIPDHLHSNIPGYVLLFTESRLMYYNRIWLNFDSGCWISLELSCPVDHYISLLYPYLRKLCINPFLGRYIIYVWTRVLIVCGCVSSTKGNHVAQSLSMGALKCESIKGKRKSNFMWWERERVRG